MIVTVIIFSFNHQRYVAQAIESKEKTECMLNVS